MIKTIYTITNPKIPQSTTFAVVADLHERRPDEVLAILSDVRPDFILVPGDLLERHCGKNMDREDKSLFSRLVCRTIHTFDYFIAGHPELFRRRRTVGQRENAYTFLREAGKLAPVIMSRGNHELQLEHEDRQIIKESGVILLEDGMQSVNGILFGGLSSKSVTGEVNTAFLSDFSGKDGFKLLLCHHPEYGSELENYSIDLILSGHAHGGQFRFFGRGIFSPGQGLFPKYTKGIYPLKNSTLIVSAGCANTASLPRLHNPTEVVILQVGKV